MQFVTVTSDIVEVSPLATMSNRMDDCGGVELSASAVPAPAFEISPETGILGSRESADSQAVRRNSLKIVEMRPTLVANEASPQFTDEATYAQKRLEVMRRVTEGRRNSAVSSTGSAELLPTVLRSKSDDNLTNTRDQDVILRLSSHGLILFFLDAFVDSMEWPH